MRNNDIKEVVSTLKEAEKILLFPHVNIDGDAMGSCVALCNALIQLNKECVILIEGAVPSNLKFLDNGFITSDYSSHIDADLCICVDCNALDRIAKRKDIFFAGKKTMCIDHHVVGELFCDINYIFPNRAATGELMLEVIEALGVRIDSASANGIYAAIITDTGGFRFSNTTKKTHQIVCKLYDYGVEADKVSSYIHDSVSIETFRLTQQVMEKTILFGDKKCAATFVTQDMLKSTNARMEDTEGFVDIVRAIKGVELAAFLKENKDKSVKVSIRSKEKYDVLGIATKFGGGGHRKAAGFTIEECMSEAIEIIKEAMLETMKTQ